VTGVPEPEPLQQHSDALASFGHAVEPAVELEVLERGQLPVDQRLMAEEADAAPGDLNVEPAGCGRGEASAEAEQCRLPGTIGAGDEQKTLTSELEAHSAQDAPPTIVLLQPVSVDHSGTVVAAAIENTEPPREGSNSARA
jgi:hypothetical protein